MLTFDVAQARYMSAKDKRKGKPTPDVNTRIVYVNEDTYAIQYHQTKVVLIHRDGTYTLNSGGYRTPTTKKRINDYSPVKVFQKKHEWYIGEGKPFIDYMKVR